MGSLTLPSAGLVYLDTDAVIYSVEKIDPYAPLLQPLWLAAQAGSFMVVSSELTLLETLVKPFRDGDDVLATAFRALLLASREVRLLPISQALLEDAARLRATIGLKTPDALHAAAALAAGCALFVTNDHAYRRMAGLPVAILDDVLVSL
jgi:predicted nucleic acid-binding protein